MKIGQFCIFGLNLYRYNAKRFQNDCWFSIYLYFLCQANCLLSGLRNIACFHHCLRFLMIHKMHLWQLTLRSGSCILHSETINVGIIFHAFYFAFQFICWLIWNETCIYFFPVRKRNNLNGFRQLVVAFHIWWVNVSSQIFAAIEILTFFNQSIFSHVYHAYLKFLEVLNYFM